MVDRIPVCVCVCVGGGGGGGGGLGCVCYLCVVHRTVNQSFACVLVPFVWTWYGVTVNVCFVLM